jgi:hypothetical protein
MANSKKKSYSYIGNRIQNNEQLDFDVYYDMRDEGIPVSEIAQQLMVDEQFLDSMIKESYKDS